MLSHRLITNPRARFWRRGTSRGRSVWSSAGAAARRQVCRRARSPRLTANSRSAAASSLRPRNSRLITVPTGHLHDLGDLLVGQALHVAQDDRGAEVIGQRVERALHVVATRCARAAPARATACRSRRRGRARHRSRPARRVAASSTSRLRFLRWYSLMNVFVTIRSSHALQFESCSNESQNRYARSSDVLHEVLGVARRCASADRPRRRARRGGPAPGARTRCAFRERRAFVGVYLSPPPNCSRNWRAATRRRSRRLISRSLAPGTACAARPAPRRPPRAGPCPCTC